MSRTKQSRGKCQYCGHETTKGPMKKHLLACPQRLKAIEEANAGRKQAVADTLYYLRAQDAWRGQFWLDLEVRGSSTLATLDAYLRAIWLECCGHLSQFSIGGWRGDEISMKRKIEDVFQSGTELTHIYDFGTSSITLVKALDTHQGKPTTRHPIALMARNLMPESLCIQCNQPAAWLCMECLIEEDTWGTLCDKHAKSHPHDNYGDPIPLVNSPRLGMCGYDGPAEPPY